MSGVNNPYRYQYETVAASQTDQVMGATGALGDYLDHCLIIVATAATAVTGTITGLLGGTFTYVQQIGTLTGTGANLTYTPAANYNGADSFTYQVSDSRGGTLVLNKDPAQAARPSGSASISQAATWQPASTNPIGCSKGAPPEKTKAR